MSDFPRRPTKDESKERFDEFVAFLEAKGVPKAQALDRALDMHRIWLQGAFRRATPATEYRVVYRREGWGQTQCRLYQRKGSAEAFMAKLARPTTKYAAIVELRLEERPVVAEWATVTEAVTP